MHDLYFYSTDLIFFFFEGRIWPGVTDTASIESGPVRIRAFQHALLSRYFYTAVDQSYHAWIRSEKNPSIRSDACMTADYARGQPASAWPLAGQPCRVDCDLHTIARAHNNTFFVRLVRALGPHVAAVECVIMCTPIMHSTPSKLMPKWHFFV